MKRLYIRKGAEKIEDEDIVRKIRCGDRHAFQQCIERYRRHIFHIAYSVVHQRTDAEDIAQEVFIQIYRSLSQYDGKGFKTWISRIALHKAIDYRRKLLRSKEEAVEHITDAVSDEQMVANSLAGDVMTEVIVRDRKERLRMELKQIPALHREMIEAYYLEEKSYEQIAADSDISMKTVESRLYRARHWLRTHWREEDWR